MIRRLTLLTPVLALMAPTHAQDAHSSLPAPPVATGPGSGGTVTQTQNAAERIVVEFSDVAGDPTSAVPGVPGASFSSFDRIFGSRNGNTIFSADTDLATTEDEVVVSNGVVVAREGTSVTGAPGENVGLIDTRLSINDNGDFTYATNTDAATTIDEVIVARVGGVTSVIAREGDPIPPLPGTTYGITLDSSLVIGNGAIGFAASSIIGATTTTNEVLILGNTLLLQRGVSVPTGQAGGASEFVDIIDLDGFHASDNGLRWVVQGDLTGATTSDDVVIFNGAVVLQEGSIIAGSSFSDPIDLNGILEISMDPAGNWYARGDNINTQQDWVVRNGAVIAAVGSPVIQGSTELWSDATFAACFFLQTGNGVGDYLIGGVSDIGVANDGILVLNGERVVAREGEPIDLDGNGFFDDDVFINTFGNDDAFLADDLTMYIVVTLKNGAGTSIGEAVIRRDLADGVGSTYCTTQANSTGAPAFIGGAGSSTALDNDLTLTVCQLPSGSNGYFIVSRDQGVIVNPAGQQGSICVASPAMGRYSLSILTAGAAGTVSLVLNLTAVPQPTGSVPALAGDTWNWQYWYRDVNPTVTSNFSTALSVTFN